jgi:hypothetical protein
MMNILNLAVIFTLLVLNIQSFGQNNVYIISEKFDNQTDVWSYDSVFVTDPTGAITTYTIPNPLVNLSAHDSELNTIINSVTALGYKIDQAGAWYAGNPSPAPQAFVIYSWYLTEP